jgi:hypothetical protein
LVVQLDDPTYQIDREVAGSEHWSFALQLELMAQRHAHAREQFSIPNGLVT